MAVYYSTFFSGVQDFIREVMEKKIRDLKIVSLLDGAVLYETNLLIDRVKAFRFFNNSFLVFRTFKDPEGIGSMIRTVLAEQGTEISKILSSYGFGDSFRIITSVENKLVSADDNLLTALERRLSTGKFKVDRLTPEVEFWFLQRREGAGFFMIRLTKHKSSEKTLRKGELRREVTHVMCLMSEPSAGDVVLDPFCGYGSIVVERSHVPFAKLIAVDNDSVKVEEVKKRLSGSPGAVVEQADSLGLSFIPGGSVDRIITDPPWGEFEKIDEEKFYPAMFTEFSRVLKKTGRIILLTSLKDLMERLITDFGMLKKARYDVLISGRKAALFVIKNREI